MREAVNVAIWGFDVFTGVVEVGVKNYSLAADMRRWTTLVAAALTMFGAGRRALPLVSSTARDGKYAILLFTLCMLAEGRSLV